MPSRIPKELFTFLRELREHNERAWFLENKARYEAVVRDPLLRFIEEIGPGLRKISRHLRADPRPVGGSLFRIYRDTRFSRDKSPYKTHAAAHFPHAKGGDVHAPGYYVHFEPGDSFMGGGLWRPDPAQADRIRSAILAKPEGWKKAVGSKAFRARCELGGDALKRPPRGVPPDHPLLEDLKRKDFIYSAQFSEAEVCSPRFSALFLEACRLGAPMMSFLAGAVRMSW